MIRSFGLETIFSARTGRIVFCKGEQAECEWLFERLLGQKPDKLTLFQLAAAPESAVVTAGIDSEGLLLDAFEPIRIGLTAQTRVVIAADGERFLALDDFRILRRQYRRRKIGTALLAQQIETAKKYGLSRIVAQSNRSTDENGWYTLPRLGFDAPLPNSLRTNERRTVLDVMATDDGRRFWFEQGDGLELSFDLADGSRSMKCLKRYLLEKGVS